MHEPGGPASAINPAAASSLRMSQIRAQVRSWALPGRATASVTYRQAVAVPTPNPAGVSPLRRWTRTSKAYCPGFSLRQHDPILAR